MTEIYDLNLIMMYKIALCRLQASLSFAPVRRDGTGADPAFTWLLLGRPRGEILLAGAAETLATVRNLAVPLDADGVATLQRLGSRFPALRSLGIVLRMCVLESQLHTS